MDLPKINKIKASTLSEVVIAMVLLGIISSIAIITFNNIYHTGSTLKEEEIYMSVDNEIHKAFESGTARNETIEMDNFSIVIEYTDHLDIENLKIGYFSAYIKDEKEAILEKRILLNVQRLD